MTELQAAELLVVVKGVFFAVRVLLFVGAASLGALFLLAYKIARRS